VTPQNQRPPADCRATSEHLRALADQLAGVPSQISTRLHQQTQRPPRPGLIRRRLSVTGLVLLLVVIGIGIAASCTPQPAYAAVASAATVRVPEKSALYRLRIEREAARYFGLNAQPARMAAQIHQESAWNERARSPYAHGLTQFTPATANWLPAVCPQIGTPDPWNANWALAAQACYMGWLYDRVPRLPGSALLPCTRWAFALRAYNGGEGWLLRERRAAAAQGADPNDWHAMAPYRVRARWAHKENTEYPQRILLRIEPAYIAAGWPGGPACS
jgi:hypothetical protein